MIAVVAGRLAAHLGLGSLAFAASLSLAYSLPTPFLRFSALAAALLATASAFLAGDWSSIVARATVAAVGFAWYVTLRLRALGHSTSVESEESARAVAGRAAASVARTERRETPVSAALAIAVAVAGLSLERCAAADSWHCAAGSLSSAFLLGSTAVSMLLGHWYLVDPKLAITPLKTGALGFALASGLRTAFVAWTLAGGGHTALRLSSPSDLIYSTPALFFLMRALTGLGGPLLLAGLIWQTVRMRSTQSATGLLYVAVILVLFGELISDFLTVATGLPL